MYTNLKFCVIPISLFCRSILTSLLHFWRETHFFFGHYSLVLVIFTCALLATCSGSGTTFVFWFIFTGDHSPRANSFGIIHQFGICVAGRTT